MNRGWLDEWTIVHAATGFLAGALGRDFRTSMSWAVLYEVVEHTVERTAWGQRVFGSKEPETFPNMIGDLVAFAVGHKIGGAI